MEDSNKCSHVPCSCTAAAGDDYCSDNCREDAESPASQQPDEGRRSCRCAHEHCSAEGVSIAEAEGLRLASEVLAS